MAGKKSKRKGRQARKTKKGAPEPAKRFAPPTSGVILGALVDVLRLRDKNADLTDKTAQRYLKGHLGVSPESVNTVQRAIASALVEIGLDFGVEGSEGRDLVADLIAWNAHQWDQLGGALRSNSCPVSKQDEVIAAFLRLVSIDFAIRYAAWALVKSKVRPDESTLPESVGALLLRWRESLAEAPSVTATAKSLGVAASTLKSWLYQGKRPNAVTLEALADLFQPLLDRPRDELLTELRVVDAVAAVQSSLAPVVGQGTVTRIRKKVFEFAGWIFDEHEDSPDQHEFLDCVLNGTRADIAVDICQLLWRCESDALWREDLRHASRDWTERLQAAARAWSAFEVVVAERMKDKDCTRAQAEFSAAVVITYGLCDTTGSTPGSSSKSAPAPVDAEKAKAAKYARDADKEAAAGNYEAAVELWRLAIEHHPDSADYHYRLGSDLGELALLPVADREVLRDEAIDALWVADRLCREMTTHLPDDRPRAEIGLIRFKFALSTGNELEIHAAFDHLEESVAHVTVTEFLARTLGHARMFLGDLEGAVECFDFCLAKNPDSAAEIDYKARCLYLMGRRRPALQAAKEASHKGVGNTLAEIESGRLSEMTRQTYQRAQRSMYGYVRRREGRSARIKS